MRKFLIALTLTTIAALASITGAKAAPVAALATFQQSMNTGTAIEGLTLVHRRNRRHRHGGRWHGPGIYIGPGFGIYGRDYRRSRSCRSVRRWCRREWGGGRSYRRCVRRQGCRPR